MLYRVEHFVRGGNLFRNLARLSAAGLPVVTVTHGSSTAGGAYQTGLSDYIVMVRGRSRAFLAGPPLLMAATGEVASEEELGGAEMHTTISGLGDYLAEDDRDAIRVAREILAEASIGRARPQRRAPSSRRAWTPKSCSASCRSMHKRPVDMKRGDRAYRRRLRLPGLRRKLRRRHRVRPHQARRLAAGRDHQQRPDRCATAPTRPRTSSRLLPVAHADRLPAEHHRLHGGPCARGGRHDQARRQDDPGGDQCHGAADHAALRRLVRRRQLRHVRPRLRTRGSAFRGPTPRPR